VEFSKFLTQDLEVATEVATALTIALMTTAPTTPTPPITIPPKSNPNIMIHNRR
jgi:hypothetical protein